MASDLDDLIGPTAEPHVAVFVDCSRIAREIDRLARDAFPIIVRIALSFAPQAGGQARERLLDDHDPLLARRALGAIGVDHRAVDTRQGDSGRARLDGQHRDAVRVAEDGAAGLRLPHVVHHRDAVVEDLALEPLPGRRVQDLAGAEDALEARQVEALGRLGAVPHEQTDGSG